MLIGQQMDEFLLNPFLLSLITLLTLLWFLTKRTCKNSSKKKQPPSPPSLPILGNLHQLSMLTHRSLQSLGSKHGPIMLLHFGSRPVIVVQSADSAAEIMRTHNLVFAERPYTSTMSRLLYDGKDLVVAPYGEYWRKLRSICVLQLLSAKRVQSLCFIREEEAALLINTIRGSSGSPLNLSELLDSVINGVVFRAALGRKYSGEELDGEEVPMLLREVVHLLGSASVGEYIPCLSWFNRVNGFNGRVERAAVRVDAFLESIIRKRLTEASKDESRVNFVDILLDIYKDNTTGVPIDITSIKAIIMNMIFAGIDTTSASLEWTMTELLRHPPVLQKLQTEVKQVMKIRGNSIREEELGEMHYLKAVVKETLRVHPPVPFTARVARQDVEVMGYDVARGTMVLINTWAIGRDPASWDEPEKFMPERFLNSSVDYKGLDFGLIPFGSGRRGCPGMGFAGASVELVLANLVHKFEWELPHGTVLDTIEHPGGAVHRKHPLLAIATPC